MIAEAQNVGPRQSENGQSVPVILVQIRPQFSFKEIFSPNRRYTTVLRDNFFVSFVTFRFESGRTMRTKWLRFT